MQVQLWLLAYTLGLVAVGFVPLGWYFIETGEEYGALKLRRRGEHFAARGSLMCVACVLAGAVVHTVMVAGGDHM